MRIITAMGSKFSSYKQIPVSPLLEAPSCNQTEQGRSLLEEFKRNPHAKMPVRIHISGDLDHWLEKDKGNVSHGESATLVGEVRMNCSYQKYLELIQLPIVKGIYRST